MKRFKICVFVCLAMLISIAVYAREGVPVMVLETGSPNDIRVHTTLDTSEGVVIPTGWIPWTEAADSVTKLWDGWASCNLDTSFGKAVMTVALSEPVKSYDNNSINSNAGVWIVQLDDNGTTWYRISEVSSTIPVKSVAYNWEVSCLVDQETLTRSGSAIVFSSLWSDINTQMAAIYAQYASTSDLGPFDVSILETVDWTAP